MWSPTQLPEAPSKFEALARAIADAVASGELAAGDQLPTHRQLAEQLGVTIGTVTRGYAEARRRGLLEATVGRGTFVRGRLQPPRSAATDKDSQPTDPVSAGSTPSTAPIEFGLNCPAPLLTDELQAAFATLSDPSVLEEVLRYSESTGLLRHRQVVADWLSERALPTAADQVVITTGCQQALMLALAHSCNRGDVVLTEELTYSGTLAAARLLDLRSETVALDEHGLVPEAFEAACARHRPSALYCIPTLQNPTATVMPEERRKRIAAIADAHEVAIIEDEVQAYLVEDRPAPLLSFAQLPGYYLNGLSKSVAGGLRTGFLRVQAVDEELDSHLWATTILTPPAMAEVAVYLLAGPGLWTIEEQRRATAKQRFALAQEHIGPWLAASSSPFSQFAWMELPPKEVPGVISRAAARGLTLTPGTQFSLAAKPARAGIRVALSNEQDNARIEYGLVQLREVLKSSRRRRVFGS